MLLILIELKFKNIIFFSISYALKKYNSIFWISKRILINKMLASYFIFISLNNNFISASSGEYAGRFIIHRSNFLNTSNVEYE